VVRQSETVKRETQDGMLHTLRSQNLWATHCGTRSFAARREQRKLFWRRAVASPLSGTALIEGLHRASVPHGSGRNTSLLADEAQRRARRPRADAHSGCDGQARHLIPPDPLGAVSALLLSEAAIYVVSNDALFRILKP